MAKKIPIRTVKKVGFDPVYSHVVISKPKLWSISVLTVVMTVVISVFIFTNLIYDISWGVIAFPAGLMASVLLLAPVSEQWNYKPWQRYPQQIEHHYND